MVKCPECKKEVSTPEMEMDFRDGKENTGNRFRCTAYLRVIEVLRK
jgi:hypothetical protein